MSGARGPLSNPNAVRYPTKTTKIQLPAGGYQGEIPDWPLVEATMPELERWERLWRTPIAALWAPMSIETTIARYVRIALLAEDSDQATSVAMSNIKGEARQLEKELGIGPSALQRLNCEIASDEVAERRADTVKAPRRIAAVDPATG